MIGLTVGISTSLLIMMALVTVLVAWTVRREETAATMTAKPPGCAARVVRRLLGLHVIGYSFAPGKEDGAPQRHRPADWPIGQGSAAPHAPGHQAYPGAAHRDSDDPVAP